MEYAGLWRRLGAFIIDALLVSFISLPLWVWLLLSISDTTPTPMYFLTTAVFIIWFFFSIFYFTGYWAWCGQTPGQMLAGIKVVRLDRQNTGIVRSIIRCLIGYSIYYALFVFFIIPGIGLLILIAVNKQKRGIHDLISGTHVIVIR